MIAMSLGEIAAAVDGDVVDASPELVVTAPPSIDSRVVSTGGLFVAVAGEHVDGHDYAARAIEAGAVAVLASRPVGVAAVVVPDVVEALGRLTHFVVSRLTDVVVIGITGSQGKTSTKDIVAQLLETQGETVAPLGNFNNELGVPLTALRATSSTRFLVAELGARGKGHITYLSSIVRPRIGAVLNVGVAHVGEFGSRAAIAEAKGELVEGLAPDGLAVLNRDDPLVTAMTARTEAPVLTFGEADGADVRVSDIGLDDVGHARFTLSYRGRSRAVVLGLFGEHQAMNAAAGTAMAIGAGMDFDDACDALGQVAPRSRWRMEVTDNAAGVTVINDAYNANPDSMRAALKTLADLGHRRRAAGSRTIAVLGEMAELGDSAREEHDAIGRLVVRLDIDQLVVVGEAARALHLGASLEGSWNGESVLVPDADAAISLVQGVVRPGDVVLVKASRSAGLEKVAAGLSTDPEQPVGGSARSGATRPADEEDGT